MSEKNSEFLAFAGDDSDDPQYEDPADREYSSEESGLVLAKEVHNYQEIKESVAND